MIPPVDTVFVMSQTYAGQKRIRYRVHGADLSEKDLKEMDAFKIKFSSNVSEEDKDKVQEKWELKIMETI